MFTDDYGVRHLGTSVRYEDGAEDSILTILLEVADRSDGSDELAARIQDWPTKYHLSPQRSNLLRSLNIGAGDRVLELGCGSGPITRWLGERGARVTAIDGNVQRARAAAVRCRDLSNVDVAFGDIADLDLGETFDYVVCIGVLEYSTAGESPGGPHQFLATCTRHLESDGALVLAIENQLGLKYLIGFAEDHRGVPWVGLDGYASPGPRTWSRRQLSEMLAGHGLSEQRWFFPFPDYKLPVAVVAADLYGRADHADIIDGFVREPVSSDASAPTLSCDARRAHRVLLDAGLGSEVANSFLVVAGADRSRVAHAADDALLWYHGSNRLRPWRTHRRLVSDPDGGLVVESIEVTEDVVERGWLSQAPRGRRELAAGTTVDAAVTEMLSTNDLDGLGELLARWVGALVEDGGDASAPHPFSPGPGEPSLRRDHLDISLSNYVVTADGLEFIDSEWHASGPIDRDLAITRALWYFAHDVVRHHRPNPWGSIASVDALCELLMSCAGAGAARLEKFRVAESCLQEIVTGVNRAAVHDEICRIGAVRTIDARPRETSYLAVRHELAELRELAQRTQSERDEWRRNSADLEQDRDRLFEEFEHARHRHHELEGSHELLRAEYDGVVRELERIRVELAGLGADLAVAEKARETLETDAEEVRSQLAALRATRTFRWTAPLRNAVARLRG